jgi:hypothetical protein
MLHTELQSIKPIMSRYAARYHLSGPDKDKLVEDTFLTLANDPDALADGPVEKAVAETMHRVFLKHTPHS